MGVIKIKVYLSDDMDRLIRWVVSMSEYKPIGRDLDFQHFLIFKSRLDLERCLPSILRATT